MTATASDIPVTPAEDEAFKALEQKLTPQRHHEWHVTVEGDVSAWLDFCSKRWSVKPLLIELSDKRLQLMCAMSTSPEEGGTPFLVDAEAMGFKIIRIKHEVSALLKDEEYVYFEAHAKFDGKFRDDRLGSSRDVLRSASPKQRWYLTLRSKVPFNVDLFTERARGWGKGSVLAEVEAEYCLLDTNPGLDDGWLDR